MVRDVDRLDRLPDGDIRDLDQQYLDQHKLDELFSTIVENIVMQQPPDPVQYIIDSIEFGPGEAQQDVKTGLPAYRLQKLEGVFASIDKAGTGKVSFKMLQAYTNKFGGKTLKEELLRTIFKDFKPDRDNMIGLDEFLMFFSHVSKTITNADFSTMIGHMMKA